MVRIPIDNETPYTFTDAMRQDILRDAQEHFGEVVRSIRVQEGLERHVFNTRTHQMRYAFSPTDFGLRRLITPAPATTGRGPDSACRAAVIGGEGWTAHL